MCSPSMDFDLVFFLTLTILCSRQSLSEQTKQASGDQCYQKCPAGYYKISNCKNEVGLYKCKQCENNTYTEVENFTEKCKRCKLCNHDEVVKKSCSFNSNTVCEKKNKCHCEDCKGPNGNHKPIHMCLDCQREGCQKVTASTTSISPTTLIPTKPLNRTENPYVHQSSNIADHMLLVVVLIFVLFGVALLFMGFHGCTCWSIKTGHHSPQDSKQSTVTFKISEESPMMSPNDSPDSTQHPAHIPSIPPHAVHAVAKQDEQSEHWPPIVLYEIIKEVPLRRWKEFLRLLSLGDQELERMELETGLGLGSMERQYQMLRLWSQRSSASLNNVFSALHYMELSGCAQLLQENLEKLQFRPEKNQGVTAGRDFSVAMWDV